MGSMGNNMANMRNMDEIFLVNDVANLQQDYEVNLNIFSASRASQQQIDINKFEI